MRHQSNSTWKKSITPAHLCFVLTICSLLLPWFGYNLRVQSPCRGIHFLGWFFIPLLIIGIYLFTPIRKTILTIAVELCSIAYIVLMVLSIGYYHVVWNIAGGWHWLDGWHAVLPGFWISAVCFLLFFIAFQCDLWTKRKNL